MSAEAVRRIATYQDVLDAPEHLVTELVDGDLYASPRPASRHARAGSALGSLVGSPFDLKRGGPGGWWIIDEPEIHLVGDIVVPDLAGWRRERMPEYPNTPFFTQAPDWICEILSPSTARLDRVVKLPLYARNGVEWAWVIDVEARSLEVFKLQAGRYTLWQTFSGDEPVPAEPFEAVPWSWGSSGADQPRNSSRTTRLTTEGRAR